MKNETRKVIKKLVKVGGPTVQFISDISWREVEGTSTTSLHINYPIKKKDVMISIRH